MLHLVWIIIVKYFVQTDNKDNNIFKNLPSTVKIGKTYLNFRIRLYIVTSNAKYILQLFFFLVC